MTDALRTHPVVLQPEQRAGNMYTFELYCRLKKKMLSIRNSNEDSLSYMKN